jgi:hypothetical protein
METPLLTIYTPHLAGKRPKLLARCMQSVADQRDKDIQHLIIPDYVGIGLNEVCRAIADNHGAIRGKYVYILSDDDVLAHSRIVSGFRAFVEQKIADRYYPPTHLWKKPPVVAQISGGCWIVKREVWVAHEWGACREGDFQFLQSVLAHEPKYTVAWWDQVVTIAERWMNGEPE